MSAFLKTITKIVSFADNTTTVAPQQRLADWTREISDVNVENPRTEMRTLAPSEEALFFNGSNALTIDGTTTFSLSLVPGSADRYRLTHTTGTSPGFRTARALNLTGATVAVAVNPNGLATMTITTGAPTFALAQVGDTVYLPPVTEIGTQPFSAPNQGLWLVVGRTNSAVSMTRATDDFEALAETVAVTAANQFQAYSAAGVQVGSRAELLQGFATSSLHSYPVVAVTASYLEIESSIPLAEEVGVLPTAAGLIVYTSAKRMVYIETDQEVAVKINGDTTERHQVAPWIGADSGNPGQYQKTGSCWSLAIKNRSLKTANVVVISVE